MKLRFDSISARDPPVGPAALVVLDDVFTTRKRGADELLRMWTGTASRHCKLAALLAVQNVGFMLPAMRADSLLHVRARPNGLAVELALPRVATRREPMIID